MSNSITNDNEDNVFSMIFNKSNIIYLIWFLAIYLIIYLIMGIFYNSGNSANKTLMASRIFDLLFFFFILFPIILFLFLSEADKKDSIKEFQKMVKDFLYYLNDPYSIIYTLFSILVFYIFIYLIGIPMSYEEKPISIKIIESIFWIEVILIIIVQFFKFVLGVSIIDLFYDWISDIWTNLKDTHEYKIYDEPEKKDDKKDISGNAVVSGNTIASPMKEEVFNVANNLYTYDDAKAICKAYGARIATYDDIEKTYKDGGEWCNYGWSDNQMIFFPTQKSTWLELQKDPNTKNNCGRPGINGGYIDNPYMKFGVNCYGKKPDPSTTDLALLNDKRNQITPKTPEDELLDKKVQFWKDHASQLLQLNSFNNNKWSVY